MLRWPTAPTQEDIIELGASSLSLSVADIGVSRAFYEALGFEVGAGDMDQNWLILRNGETVIGLFQGMFEGNILSFSPGLNNHMEAVEPFTDIRELQNQLDAAGIDLTSRIGDDNQSGPASVTLVDPDGNSILIDQHR